MSRKQKFILAGIAVLAAVVLVLLFAPGDPDDKPPPVAGKAAPSKTKTKPEAQFRFDTGIAKKRFAERSAVAFASKVASGDTYGYAGVSIKGDEAIAAFFDSLHGGNPAGMVLTATVTVGGQSLPTMPILAATRGKNGTLKIEYRLATGEPKPVSPAFALDGRKATISLSAGYLDAAVADEVGLAAAEAAAAMDGAPLWPGPEGALPGAKAFGAAAGAFANRFLIGAKDRIDPLAIVDIGGAEEAKSASLTLKDPAGGTVGEIGFTLATLAPMLPASADFRNIATMTVGSGISVGDHLREQPAAARVLLEPSAGLTEACRDLTQGLRARLGLAAVDAGRVADAVAGVRGRLGLPDAATCSGPRPVAKDFADVGAMNRALDRLAGAMRAGAPATSAKRLGPLFAADMTLADYSRLWLPGAEAGLIQGPAHVAPSVEAGIAAELLAGLPIARIGCYGAGRVGGGHRAALVELAHDNGLWLLDLGFDAKGKVDAVVFRAAQQADLCRAGGGRKSGPNACPFAAPGRAYRGLDPGRC